ncbi:MAG: YkgJ family cysteine cluster protein [Pseudomonadales bacterium]|nr:YkgJ family cysteine cluster protein [Pseudomonadales bacterium]
MQPCNQCGKCCLKYADGGLVATSAEIDQWENLRPDIYAYVHQGAIWCDPKTAAPLSVCPFLEKNQQAGITQYSCGIYTDRPQDCRSYPVTIDDMIQDECEMIEVKDLQDYAKAQQTLDRLMDASRPSVGGNS